MKNLEGEMYQILLVQNVRENEESSIKGVIKIFIIYICLINFLYEIRKKK